MPKPTQAAAVIDIGSTALRLNIAQATKTNEIKYLENMHFPLSLGRDTFNTGKISFDKVDKACEVVNNFLHVAKGYGVRPQSVRVTASTALREAANADYVLDQIKIKTGVTVHVMDDLEEKRSIYKLLAHYANEPLRQSAVLVYIGTGSMGINLLTDGKMPRTWNIRVSSLRMSELFGDLQEYTRDFFRLMEEYLAGYTYKLRDEMPEDIKHIIVSGQEIDVVASCILPEIPTTPLFELPRKSFETLYEKIKRKTPDSIAREFNLDTENAESLLPAAYIYQTLLDCTNAKAITASRLLPCDAVLFEMLLPKPLAAMDKRFDKGTILSAKEIAARHNANIPHCELVRDNALLIFDRLKKLHGLETRDKLLLSAAAYLHDIGEYINPQEHHIASHELVLRMDIVGLSQTEQAIVALICRYHTSTPDLTIPRYAALSKSTKVRVSKLAAMLRIADAMDRSHRQKPKTADVKLNENTLIVTVTAHENMALEQWAFKEKARFFEEVFGIKAELRVKNGA